MILFFVFFGGVPVYLAEIQDVPTRFGLQHAVLLASLAGFGLMLGLFWLSRLMPGDAVKMRFSSTLRWHKYIGYVAGLFMLAHPVLMVMRRFWAVESNPVHNLVLVVTSPLMLTGVVAWCLLVVLTATAFSGSTCRRKPSAMSTPRWRLCLWCCPPGTSSRWGATAIR